MNGIKPQLFILRKWLWLLMLGLIIGAAAGYRDSSSTQALYQASAKIMISSAVTDTSDANAIYVQSQMVKSYAEMINNPAMVENLRTILGYRVGQGQISATPVVNTLAMWVYARHENPRRAADIANVSAQAITAYFRDLQDQRYAAAENDLEARIARAKVKVTVLQWQFDRAAARNSEPPTLQKLQNELALQQQIYTDLLDQQTGLRAEKLRTQPQAALLQAATVPTNAIPRKRPQTSFTYALVGLMAAGALALTIEMIDDRIHTPEDAEQQLGLAVLGLSPVSGQGAPNASEQEAYQLIQTNLALAAKKSIQTLLVAEPGAGAGKSAAARQLARTYAQDGHKTILLDLHSQALQSGEAGPDPKTTLMDMDAAADMQPAPLPAWGEPPLHIVAPCIKPGDSPTTVGLGKLQAAVQTLKEAAECVVIGIPAVPTAESLGLAAVCDAVIVVVSAGKTRRGPAQLLTSQLQRAGANLLGVVVETGRGWPYYSRYNDLLHHYRTGK